jgi:hypothetical protein
VTGALRRDVNCQGGQCVLQGCLADVDCAEGFLCIEKKCVSGRRVTAPTRVVELCSVSGSSISCATSTESSAAREGLTAECLRRDGPRCMNALLFGGTSDAANAAELRDSAAAITGPLAVSECVSPGACAPAFAVAHEEARGALVLGGVIQSDGARTYRFISAAYLVAPEASAVLPIAARLSTPRAFLSTAGFGGGILAVGGAAEDLAPRAEGTLLLPSEAGYSLEEPQGLRLSTPRFGHTATALNDGRVVVVGGTDGEKVLSSVEILTPRSVLR